MKLIIFGVMYFLSRQLSEHVKVKFTSMAIVSIMLTICAAIIHPTLFSSIVNADWQSKALLLLSFFGDIIAIGVLTLMHSEIKSKDLKATEVKGMLLSLFGGILLASITLTTSSVLITIASCVIVLLTSAVLMQRTVINESDEKLKIIGFIGCLYFSMRPVEYIALLNVMTVADLTGFTILWFSIIGLALKFKTSSFETVHCRDIMMAIPVAIMGVCVLYSLVLNESEIFNYTICYCYILIFDMRIKNNLGKLNNKAKENIFNSFKESGAEITKALKESVRYMKSRR